MRVFLLGANGFIGSAVLSRLERAGHEVVAVARAPLNTDGPRTRWIRLDISRAITVADWLPHIAGVDAVVNCAGALQGGPGANLRGVHVTGVAALFEACERVGIRRVIHLSAIGVDRDTPTAFSATKHAGEQALMSRNLDWIILRPSVVVGRGAYGGSALFRGLAALPMTPIVRGAGALQVVQRDDLVATIAFFLSPDAPSRQAFDVVGPQRLSLADVIRAYRRWLGWPDAPSLPMPSWVMRVGYALGDLAGLLGWRSPVRSTAGREILRGAIGDPTAWSRTTGIEPQALDAALASEPASVQERWFARLYFLKPLVFGVFSLFWIVTGLVSLDAGYWIGIALMEQAGSGSWLARISVVAGALTDILVGAAIAVRRTARFGLYAALAVMGFYLVAGTILMPLLWADPLGALLKIFPLVVLNLVALAILEDR